MSQAWAARANLHAVVMNWPVCFLPDKDWKCSQQRTNQNKANLSTAGSKQWQDTAGHLQRGEAFPARLSAGLWQTEAVLCGVWRRPCTGLWRRLSHTYPGWTWRGQPGQESLNQLDLGMYSQEARRPSLLRIKKHIFIHCVNLSIISCNFSLNPR